MFGLPLHTSLVFSLVPTGIIILLVLWGQSFPGEGTIGEVGAVEIKRKVFAEQESV